VDGKIMWIVKLGGSLADTMDLQSWLGVLACFGGGRVIIVPGGGLFADQVRRTQQLWSFDDRVAHRMALLAMDQYGLMMAGIRADLKPAATVEAIENILGQAGVAVWTPSVMAADNRDLPENWDLTSDSLAAWLANRLKATMLLVVKSVDTSEPEISAVKLSGRGWVDPMFPIMTAHAGYETRLMGKHQFDLMERMLLTGMQGGTLIRTGLTGVARSQTKSAGRRKPHSHHG
jgi:5-(aminomethyl)-3-furanmethanol phosphate kinase